MRTALDRLCDGGLENNPTYLAEIQTALACDFVDRDREILEHRIGLNGNQWHNIGETIRAFKTTHKEILKIEQDFLNKIRKQGIAAA